MDIHAEGARPGCAKGQLVALQWLLDNEVVVDDELSVTELVTTAMGYGQMDILRWLDASFEIDQVLSENVRSAALNGDLEVMKWVYERFPSLPAEPDLLGLDLERCNARAAMWLDAQIFLDSTLPHCHADVAMWLYENKGIPLDPLMLAAFVRYGDVALLKKLLKYYAYDNGEDEEELVITASLFKNACRHGKLEMVQYMAEQHGVWSQDGMKAAAISCTSYAVMKWLFSTGRPCSYLLDAAHNLLVKGEWELTTSFAARLPVVDRLECFWPTRVLDGPNNEPPEYYPHFLYDHLNENRIWVKTLAEWTLANHPASLMHHHSLGPGPVATTTRASSASSSTLAILGCSPRATWCAS